MFLYQDDNLSQGELYKRKIIRIDKISDFSDKKLDLKQISVFLFCSPCVLMPGGRIVFTQALMMLREDQ